MDQLGGRGSPGNLMKALNRIIKLLEEIANNTKRQDSAIANEIKYGSVDSVTRYTNNSRKNVKNNGH